MFSKVEAERLEGMQHSLDKDGIQPLKIAFGRFQKLLSPTEEAKFRNITFDDVMLEVKRLENRQYASSVTRKLGSRLQPFIAFIERYANAIDSIIQADPLPSALIWGTVRILVVIASSHSRYLGKLLDMIQRISDMLPIYMEYENVLRGSVRFQTVLAEVYYDMLLFLYQAKNVFSKPGFKLLGRSIWRTFESDFGQILHRFIQHTKLLKEHILLINTVQVNELLIGQEHILLASTVQINELLNGQGHKSRPTSQAIPNFKDPSSERKVMMDWVYKADVEDDFIRESNRRVQPCGDWLLEHAVFQDWLISPGNRILRILGCPGSGKTVLSTSIIEYIQQVQYACANSCTAYFYCSKSEQNQDVLSIFASLIKQILSRFDDLPTLVGEYYNRSLKCGRSSLSMNDNPAHLLESLCSFFSQLYIVIDGLDEIKDPEDTVKNILKVVDSASSVRVLLLSRDIPKLNKRLERYPTIRISHEKTREDIDRFLMEQLTQLEFYDTELHEKVFDKLSKGADGMFLWASLMIQSLRSATSLRDAIDIVSNMPTGLDHFYRSILKGFLSRAPKMQMLARKVLVWMCCSVRPMRWDELTCVLTIDEVDESNERERKLFKSAILEACSPLVEYLPESDIFRLVHISVRDFLLNTSNSYQVDVKGILLHFEEIDAHSELADLCLAYISRLDSKMSVQDETCKFLFSEYATSFWGFHVVRSRYSPRLAEKMYEYLSSRPRRLTWIARQLFRESSGFPLQYLIKMQKQLYQWASNGEIDSDRCSRLDWIQDIGQILLDMDTFDQNQDSPCNGVAVGQSRITYFHKLMVVRDLSREYTIRGRLDEGERWMTEALRQKQAHFGVHHLSTVWLLNSLGIIYDQQQKLKLAAETQEKALSIQESNLGCDHLETVWTVNELGRVYRHLERYGESVAQHLRALQILQRLLPRDDLQLAWTMNTLARTYRAQGKPELAIEHHQMAIDIQKKALGADHPHVLWATADMGRCYRDQGEFVKSLSFHRACLEGRMRVFGPDHLDTLWAMNDLGFVLAKFRQFKEARELHQQALNGQVQLLGDTHPHTIWSKTQLEVIDAELKNRANDSSPFGLEGFIRL